MQSSFQWTTYSHLTLKFRRRIHHSSHVQVLPLWRPTSHYYFYKKITTPPVQTNVQMHSLMDAMGTAFSCNEVLSTIPSHPKIVPKMKEMPKKRREKNANAIAWPSTLQPPSVVNSNKQRSRKDGDDYENGIKEGKWSCTLVNVGLTRSDHEQVHQKVKPIPSARTRYNAQTNTLLLYLCVINSVPISALAYNTCFLRNSQTKYHWHFAIRQCDSTWHIWLSLPHPSEVVCSSSQIGGSTIGDVHAGHLLLLPPLLRGLHFMTFLNHYIWGTRCRIWWPSTILIFLVVGQAAVRGMNHRSRRLRMLDRRALRVVSPAKSKVQRANQILLAALVGLASRSKWITLPSMSIVRLRTCFQKCIVHVGNCFVRGVSWIGKYASPAFLFISFSPFFFLCASTWSFNLI